MRYLSIDLGDKRTGLALGDDVMNMATPMNVIVTGSLPHRFEQIVKAIKTEEPDALVVGLPLNMDDTEGPAAKNVRQVAAQLHDATGLTVLLVDERKTSQLADSVMAQSGLTHKQKKARRDAIAAAAILQRFLNGDVAAIP